MKTRQHEATEAFNLCTTRAKQVLLLPDAGRFDVRWDCDDDGMEMVESAIRTTSKLIDVVSMRLLSLMSVQYSGLGPPPMLDTL